jgi:hypothetical protein
MSNVSLTRPFISSRVLLRRSDANSLMGSLTWEDSVRAVPPATMQHRDRVVLYVMYVSMIMYYCEDYGLSL